MQIDVEPLRAARAAAAAAELAASLRSAAGRLEAAGPTDGGSRTLAAWLMTWAALRPALLGLAEHGDELSRATGAAMSRFRETEGGVLRPHAS